MPSALSEQRIPCQTVPGRSFTLMNGIDSAQNLSAHIQKYYEIQIVVSGQGFLTINDTRLYMSVGDTVVLTPGDCHSLSAKNNIRWYSLEFVVGEAVSEHPLYPEIQGMISRRPGDPTVCKKVGALKAIFEELFREWKGKKPLYTYAAMLLFQQILVECSRVFRSDPEIGDESLLDLFFSFVGSHMEEGDVISQFEKTYGIGKTVLSRLAKQKTDKTVFQLYMQKRFEYAADLLTNEDLPVSEIAGKCAFASVASFSKAFANYYGTSPTQFRNDRKKTAVREEESGDFYADFTPCVSFRLITEEPFSDSVRPSLPPRTYSNPKMQLL